MSACGAAQSKRLQRVCHNVLKHVWAEAGDGAALQPVLWPQIEDSSLHKCSMKTAVSSS